MNRIRWLLCATLLVAGCGASDDAGGAGDSAFSVASFANPPAEFRPQTRWWWPGGAVEAEGLRAQLDRLEGAGYGAVEIQPFMAALTGEDIRRDARVRTVGDGAFLERLHAAGCAARDRGLAWDLTFGSGWSTGGIDIEDDGARQLVAAELALTGPLSFRAALPLPEPPGWIELTNSILPAIDGFDEELVPVAVLAAPVLDEAMGEPVTLGATIDLSGYVENATLTWEVPEGSYRLLAIYENRTRHFPAGAAYPGELEDARIIDHLDRRGVEAFLDSEFAAWIDAVSDCPPRAVFVDSFELVGELPWTTSLAAKFAADLGYRIEPLLPFLFLQRGESEYVRVVQGVGPPRYRTEDDRGRRAREDYESMRSRLFAAEFVEPLRVWLRDRGIDLRLQAHGGYGDVLDTYAMADVPESEGLYGGGSYDFLRLAASAAHVAGKRFASSESFVSLNARNLTELQTRILMGRAFSAGINRLIHHGNAYPYLHRDGERWYPFQPRPDSVFTAGPLAISSDLHPDAEIWESLRALNREAARLSYTLSRGADVSEVAWLYPHWEAENFPSFDISPGAYESEISTALRRAGYNYDRVSRSMLASSDAAGAVLRIGAASYRALLVDGLDTADPALLAAVERAVEARVPVVWMGDFPRRADGLVEAASRDATVQASVEKIRAAVALADSSDEIALRLGEAGVSPSLRSSSADGLHVSTQHRAIDGGELFFLFNESFEQIAEELRIDGDFRRASLLDPTSGEERTSSTSGSVQIGLAPGRGIVVWVER